MTKKDKFLSVTFLLFSFLIFYPQYTSSKLIGWLDMPYFFFPFRSLVSELVRTNILPLWNPYILCGNPLMANMQSAVFYPLEVFYYLLPMDVAIKTLTFLSFFLFAFFTYSFFRINSISEEGSYIGAILFVFTFYITAKAVELADFNVLLWMPLVLYFCKKFSLSNKIYDLIFLAVSLSMSCLGGHPQVFSYVYLLFTALFFYYMINKNNRFVKIIKYYILTNVLFITIIILQLIPTLQFMALCKRMSNGIDFYASQQSYMTFEHLILLIFPPAAVFMSRYTSFMNWVALMELGILPLFLFILGIIKHEEKKIKIFLLVLFTISFFISFMGNMPFYKLIYNLIPFLRIINYPSKINVVWFFITCMFVSFGYDVLIKSKPEEIKLFRIWIYLSGTFVFSFYLICEIFEKSILLIWRKTFNPIIDFQKFYEITKNYELFLKNFFIYMFLFSVACFLIYFISAKQFKGKYIRSLTILFILLNIFLYHWGGYEIYTDYKYFLYKSGTIDFLMKDKDMATKRVLAPDIVNKLEHEIRGENPDAIMSYLFDTLTPNMIMTKHIMNADGFDSLEIKDFFKFKANLSSLEKPWQSNAFKLLCAKYISSRSKINDVNLKLVFSAAANIYEYKNPADFIFFIPGKNLNIIFSNDEKVISNELFNKPFDYNKKLILNEKYKNYLNQMMNKELHGKVLENNEIKYKIDNINLYSVNAKISQPGFLVCLDNDYPGWNVYVDGKKNKLLRADWTFKGVFLERGEHFIKFVYEPIIFSICAILSIAIIFMLLILGLFFYGKELRNAA